MGFDTIEINLVSIFLLIRILSILYIQTFNVQSFLVFFMASLRGVRIPKSKSVFRKSCSECPMTKESNLFLLLFKPSPTHPTRILFLSLSLKFLWLIRSKNVCFETHGQLDLGLLWIGLGCSCRRWANAFCAARLVLYCKNSWPTGPVNFFGWH